MATGDQNDMQARLRALLPARWFADVAPNLSALLLGIGNALAWVYGQIAFVAAQARLATAVGGWIDLFAYDYLGTTCPRLLGETDTAYRARVKYYLTAPRGTRPAMVAMLTYLTGRAPKIFEPKNTGDTGGYAGDANPAAGGGLLAWDDGTGTVGAGGWGCDALPCQFFMTVYRPHGSGIANFAGWASDANASAGGGLGGWSGASTNYTSNIGALAYAGDSLVPANLTDAAIYAAIAQWTPAGFIAWTYLSY